MRFYILLFTLIFTNKSFATVAGPEILEVMGFDAQEKKVFVARHYQDESGRLPSLYYFQLDGKNSEKLIPVKSIYENLPDDDIIKTENLFNQSLKKIQSRLQPLQTIPQRSLKLNMINQTYKEGDFWIYSHPDDQFNLKKYTSTFFIQSPSAKSNVVTTTNYIDPKISILNFYQIPNTKYQLTIIRYLGIPRESGYTRDEAILLLPK